MSLANLRWSGEKNLRRADEEPPKVTARLRVRVFFESAGGEVLAFDCFPLTPRAAETLRFDLAKPDSAALGTALFGADEERALSWTDPALLAKARLVVLPSQTKEPTP